METYQIRIKELREDNEETQEDIAKLLKTTKQYYGKYELGERPLPIKHLITLAKHYKTSSDYILGLPPTFNWPR